MYVGLILASALTFTSDQASVASSQAGAPANMSFQVGYATHRNGSWATEFFTRPIEGAAPEWVVRRSLLLPDGREQVMWTSGSQCPVVIDIARSVDRIEIGSLTVGGEADRPRLFVFPRLEGSSTDADNYTVWAKGIQGRGFATYKIEASSGTVAEWARAADAALQQCWLSPMSDKLG